MCIHAFTDLPTQTGSVRWPFPTLVASADHHYRPIERTSAFDDMLSVRLPVRLYIFQLIYQPIGRHQHHHYDILNMYNSLSERTTTNQQQQTSFVRAIPLTISS